jgi:hypothetical protein
MATTPTPAGQTKNNITTKSYLVKRLKDSGYAIDKLDNIEYTPADKRKFSILIDNGGNSIILTCYKDGKIQFYDGGRIHNAHLKHSTSSIQVLIEYLNDKGVVNKHWSYGKKKETA